MIGNRPYLVTSNSGVKLARIHGIYHDRESLETFFANNIVEVVFKRRTVIPINKRGTPGYRSTQRRMFCTANWSFITSSMVRKLFKWTPPKTRRPHGWYRERRLVIVWDLMKLKFRMISLDDYEIVGWKSIKSLDKQAFFTSFYRQYIKPMHYMTRYNFGDYGLPPFPEMPQS